MRFPTPSPVEPRKEMEVASQKRFTKARQPVPEHGAVALVIAADESERFFMTAAFQTLGWKLRFAQDAREARAALAAESVPVVIVDGDAQALCWREMLEQLTEVESGPEPKFIVVSRLADERLWAEVFNLGAYDLLPKPLDANEVGCVVRSALSERNAARG